MLHIEAIFLILCQIKNILCLEKAKSLFCLWFEKVKHNFFLINITIYQILMSLSLTVYKTDR